MVLGISVVMMHLHVEHVNRLQHIAVRVRVDELVVMARRVRRLVELHWWSTKVIESWIVGSLIRCLPASSTFHLVSLLRVEILIMAVVTVMPPLIITVVTAVPLLTRAMVTATPSLIIALVTAVPLLTRAMVTTTPHLIIAMVTAMPLLVVVVADSVMLILHVREPLLRLASITTPVW